MLLTDLPSCAMLEPVFIETTNCDMQTTEAQNTEPQRTGYRLGEKDGQEKAKNAYSFSESTNPGHEEIGKGGRKFED